MEDEQAVQYHDSLSVKRNARGLPSGEGWADPEDMPGEEVMQKRKTWRRVSHVAWILVPLNEANVQQDAKGLPVNPYKHLVLHGRGDLGLFGPNHAADPIITRDGSKDEPEHVRYVLVIKRKPQIDVPSDRLVALPGGFVEEGEGFQTGAIREALEEAVLGGEDVFDFLKDRVRNMTFAGFVDDPRCKYKNAWIETACFHGHLTYEESQRLRIRTDGDAEETTSAFWMKITQENLDKMYSHHGKRVQEVMFGNGWIAAPDDKAVSCMDVVSVCGFLAFVILFLCTLLSSSVAEDL